MHTYRLATKSRARPKPAAANSADKRVTIVASSCAGASGFDGSIGWGALVRNLAWTVPGNIVGGGIVVGLGYAWLGGREVGVEREAEMPAAVALD